MSSKPWELMDEDELSLVSLWIVRKIHSNNASLQGRINSGSPAAQVCRIVAFALNHQADKMWDVLEGPALDEAKSIEVQLPELLGSDVSDEAIIAEAQQQLDGVEEAIFGDVAEQLAIDKDEVVQLMALFDRNVREGNGSKNAQSAGMKLAGFAVMRAMVILAELRINRAEFV